MKRQQQLFWSMIIWVLTAVSLGACGSGGNSNETGNNTSTGAETAVGYRYDSLPDAGDSSAAVGEFRAIAKLPKTNLTYFFINGTDQLPGESERDLVRQAFAVWAGQTALTFTEVNSQEAADLDIAWATGEHGDGDPFDGGGGVLAHASFPNPFSDRKLFLHFDDAERWTNSESQDVDLLTVAIHEIGHNLGLDHSSDPNSIMFPSYSRPRRVLGSDDIAGIQSLYGAASEAPPPQVPPTAVTPQPSSQTDSDQDGLSDAEEVYQTGTSPTNPDTDGDGIGDGVEVYYRMNPLDPDMDKDGVNDGTEINNGTNPLFPDQSTAVSADLQKQVSEFLTSVIELEIQAYRQGDASVAANVMAGQVYQDLQTQINQLNSQGLIQVTAIDYYNSYIQDVRILTQTQIEVDSCETWSGTYYRVSDGTAVDAYGPTFLPQTITIEYLNTGWFVTNVVFHDASFCRATTP